MTVGNINWTPPTAYDNGTPLPLSDITGYKIFDQIGSGHVDGDGVRGAGVLRLV